MEGFLLFTAPTYSIPPSSDLPHGAVVIGGAQTSEGKKLAIHNDSGDVNREKISSYPNHTAPLAGEEHHSPSNADPKITASTASLPTQSNIAQTYTDLHEGCLSVINPEDWEKISTSRMMHIVRTDDGDHILLRTINDPSDYGLRNICMTRKDAWYSYVPKHGVVESEIFDVTLFPVDEDLKKFIFDLQMRVEREPALECILWWWDQFDNISRSPFPVDLFSVPEHLWPDVRLEVPDRGVYPGLIIHVKKG
jgi:hypothetical protein